MPRATVIAIAASLFAAGCGPMISPLTVRLDADQQKMVDGMWNNMLTPTDRLDRELLLDVLNALNDTAEEGLATDNFYSPNFGRASAFVDPRRAMLSVRLNLGR